MPAGNLEEEARRAAQDAYNRAHLEEEARRSTASLMSPMHTPPPQPFSAPFPYQHQPYHQPPSQAFYQPPSQQMQMPSYPGQGQGQAMQQQWTPGMPINYGSGLGQGSAAYPTIPGTQPPKEEPKKKGWFF